MSVHVFVHAIAPNTCSGRNVSTGLPLPLDNLPLILVSLPPFPHYIRRPTGPPFMKEGVANYSNKF